MQRAPRRDAPVVAALGDGAEAPLGGGAGRGRLHLAVRPLLPRQAHLRARLRPALRRDAATIDAAYGARTRIVLLGSIATGKYTGTLLDVFGARLLFPDAFVGRGDMSRGGLLLRASRSGEELSYIPVAGAVRRGPRPPRLPVLRRR